jgi:ABC-type lipoprotein release transport system permease subunit
MNPALSPFLYFRRNPARTLPTAFVLVLAVVLIASVVTIVRSIDLTVFTLYGYNRYLVGLVPRNALTIDAAQMQKYRALPEIGALHGAHSYQAQVKTIFGKMVFPIFGLEPEARQLIMERCGVRLAAGRMPAEGAPEAAISEEVARNLGIQLGDILAHPDSEDSYAPVTIRLVGLFRGPVWLGLTSKSLVDANSPFTWQGYLAFPRTPSEQAALDAAIDRVTDKSKARAWKFSTLVRETQTALSNLYLILNLVIGIIVTVISFVCGLLSNIYFTQRLPEIATLYAIGYARRRLLRRAALETALLCLFGWVLGALLTTALLYAVRALLLTPRGLLLNPVDVTAFVFTLPLPLAVSAFAVATIALRLKTLDPVSIIERRG